MEVGFTWGFKRAYEKWTLLGIVGPMYYFDRTNTDGIFPVNFEVNLGLGPSYQVFRIYILNSSAYW
jgi:hypothetical protein